MADFTIDETVDITDVVCPMTFVKAKVAMEELEIGQVASLFWEELSVEEVMKELIRDFKLSLENVKTQLCS